MDRIDRFAKEMEKINYFILNPLDFLYEHMENPSLTEIIECYKYICDNNQKNIQTSETYLQSLESHILGVRPIQREKNEIEENNVDYNLERRETKDITDAIKYVTYCDLNTELNSFLDSMTLEDIVRLKLYFLKEITFIKKVISEAILEDPLADISSLQTELTNYKNILDSLKKYTSKCEEKVNVTDIVNSSNIILLPSLNTSYFYQDIMQYPDRSREIKIAFDKIVDGYFLQTKDLRTIECAKENLFEYRNPNGIRVLYIVKGNLVLITSLFFKDKQKSTKISAYYEEAQKRYYAIYDYVLNNANNPDFYIEQAELVGQIYSFLETNMVVSKRLGDLNE